MAKAIRHLDFNPEKRIGFEIIPIDHHAAKSKKNLSAPHRASFYCILRIREGSIIHHVDFTPVRISGVSFLFIGRDAVQFFDQVNAFKAEVLLFTDSFFCRHESDHIFLKSSLLFNPFLHNNRVVPIVALKEMSMLWSQMQEEWKNPKTRFKQEVLQNYLHNLLLIAGREREQGELPVMKADLQKDYVLSFMDLLEMHFREQQPISFYAGYLAITNKVLNNAVKKVRGTTPKQVITDRLVLEAKRLLVYSADNIKSIAFMLGFDEPTNFVKFFKTNTGITPAAFRHNHDL